MSFFTVMRKRPNFWMRPRRAAIGQAKRHQTRVPIERVEAHAEDAGEDGPDPEAVPLLDLEGEGGEAGWLFPIAQLRPTIAVVTMARPRTAWIETFSNLHAFDDLSERCRQGSPNVLARPPQPQTHEQ